MDTEKVNEIHRCLNDAFRQLSKLLAAAEPKDRQQMLRVMTLITQTADELAVLSMGKHRRTSDENTLR